MNAKKILVPTDFSEPSLEGVKMAVTLADLYGGTVDLIHVIPLMSYYTESIDNLGLPFDMDNDLYPKVLRQVEDNLNEVAGKHIPGEHQGSVINQVGRKPSLVISEQAKKGNYDLVIMSNKGGHEVDAVRSHITEKVIRYSKIPVLSINKAFTKKEINKILVPVDGSVVANAALIPAFDFALKFDANLTLLHIIEPYTLGMEVLPPLMDDTEAVYNSLIDQLSKYFEKQPEKGFSIKRSGVAFNDYLIREHGAQSDSVEFTTVVTKAFSAHSEICDFTDNNADLVMMSTHGRTGLARVILGSTTGMVAEHLNHPLYTFRPSKEELAAEED